MNLRHVLSAVLTAAALAASPGCAPQYSGVACPHFVALGPIGGLAAPLPETTGVATASGMLIFYAPSAIRVRLVPGATETGIPVVLTAVPLPSALPSPLATPAFAGETYFAATYPRLSPATAYAFQTDATETFGCGGPSENEEITNGGFTTQ